MRFYRYLDYQPDCTDLTDLAETLLRDIKNGAGGSSTALAGDDVYVMAMPRMYVETPAQGGHAAWVDHIPALRAVSMVASEASDDYEVPDGAGVADIVALAEEAVQQVRARVTARPVSADEYLNELSEVAASLASTTEQIEATQAHRDQVVREAIAAGAKAVDVAERAGLTRQRVYQIAAE